MKRILMSRSAKVCWDALPLSLRRLIEISLENVVSLAQLRTVGGLKHVIREDDGGFRLSTMSVEVGFNVDHEVRAVFVHSLRPAPTRAEGPAPTRVEGLTPELASAPVAAE